MLKANLDSVQGSGNLHSADLQSRQSGQKISERLFVTLALSLSLAACGGGGGNEPVASIPDDSTQQELDTDATPLEGEVGVVAPFDGPTDMLPDDVAALEQVPLRVTPDNRCVAVGEPFSLSITRADSNAADAEYVNTTAYVQFTQSLGDSLQLISRVDESAEFELLQQDIVALTSEIENGSVTSFLAGFAANTPASVILKKPVVGGCLYAFRVPGYCATGFAKSGALSLSRDGVSMSAQGCDLQNPNNLAVVELGN